jgi:hypothetical protein
VTCPINWQLTIRDVCDRPMWRRARPTANTCDCAYSFYLNILYYVIMLVKTFIPIYCYLLTHMRPAHVLFRSQEGIANLGITDKDERTLS